MNVLARGCEDAQESEEHESDEEGEEGEEYLREQRRCLFSHAATTQEMSLSCCVRVRAETY